MNMCDSFPCLKDTEQSFFSKSLFFCFQSNAFCMDLLFLLSPLRARAPQSRNIAHPSVSPFLSSAAKWCLLPLFITAGCVLFRPLRTRLLNPVSNLKKRRISQMCNFFRNFSFFFWEESGKRFVCLCECWCFFHFSVRCIALPWGCLRFVSVCMCVSQCKPYDLLF